MDALDMDILDMDILDMDALEHGLSRSSPKRGAGRACPLRDREACVLIPNVANDTIPPSTGS
jgi:hypothetical protein